MFSSAVSVGIRLKAWKTKPIRSRRSVVRSLSLQPARASVAADDDLPDGGRVERGQAVHQRRLAGARRAHHRGELAGLEVDGDPGQGVHLGVARAIGLRRSTARAAGAAGEGETRS